MILDDLPLFGASDKSITMTPLYAALLLYAVVAVYDDFVPSAFYSQDDIDAIFDEIQSRIIAP